MKKEIKHIYLNCPSSPEIIRLQAIDNNDNDNEKLMLRFGYRSSKNEITFDVNKILTISMIKNLRDGLNEALHDLEQKDTEQE